MRLRKYIPRGGEASWKGLSTFKRAKLYGFVTKANPAAVHDLLTRNIWRPSRALGLPLDVSGTTLDRVLFLFIDSERHQPSQNGAPETAGIQVEQLFAVIVLGRRTWPSPTFVLFAPYVFASETPGWRAEREIYGYPQQFGRIEVSRAVGGGEPNAFSVSSRTIARFGKSATAGEHTFLRVEKAAAKGASAAAERPVSIAALARQLAAAVGITHIQAIPTYTSMIQPPPSLGATAADEWYFARGPMAPRQDSEASAATGRDSTRFNLAAVLSQSLPMLFLKQFRDVVQPTRACYQAIVEADLKVKGKVGAVYLDKYTLTLQDIDSVPLRRELGIPGKSSDPVPVDFAFRLDLKEMSIEDARVLSNPHWNPAVEVSLADETSRLPPYVDRGGEAVWRHPSLLFGARIYGFGVTVSELRQRQLLLKCINEVTAASPNKYGPGHFKVDVLPGLDTVMLMFVQYERIISSNDDDRLLGGTFYREFLVMQLAPSLAMDPPELNWFIPFIYLDTDAPRLSGREIFGYPKQFGSIEKFERYPGAAKDLDPVKKLQLSAVAFRRRSQPKASLQPVIRIDGPAAPPAILRRYRDAGEMIHDQLSGIKHGPAQPAGSGLLIEAALAFSNVGNIFLKQFRDCADPKSACYQAVCKTDTVPGQFHSGGCVDPSGYTVTVQNLESEPLLRYIAGDRKASGGQTTFPVAFAYWADLDVELTNGRVIANPYEAPYVPDVSAGVTRQMKFRSRAVRQSGRAELLELDPTAAGSPGEDY